MEDGRWRNEDAGRRTQERRERNRKGVGCVSHQGSAYPAQRQCQPTDRALVIGPEQRLERVLGQGPEQRLLFGQEQAHGQGPVLRPGQWLERGLG